MVFGECTKFGHRCCFEQQVLSRGRALRSVFIVLHSTTSTMKKNLEDQTNELFLHLCHVYPKMGGKIEVIFIFQKEALIK